MKNTHVKPTSYTQLKKVEIHEAKDACVKLAKISRERHNELLFEIGCQFIEKNAPLDLKLLTDIDLGFWEFWYWIYINDDKNIINCEKKSEQFDYISYKEALINDHYAIQMFLHNFFII
jgi:hypothetical protein